jgi:hypothetical protein
MKRLFANNFLHLIASLTGKGLLLVSGILMIHACMDIKTYPDEPIVTYKEFRYDDTTLVFKFTDGDGNFGIPSWDSFYPYNQGSPYYYNVYMTFEEMSDTGFRPAPFERPEYLNMRIMDVPQPTGQNKTMQGTIEYKFRKVLGDIDYPMPDTFRFSFYIIDLDLNKSKPVTTPPLSYGRDSAVIK